VIFLLKGETMKFKQGTRRRALEYEKDLVTYWKKHQTFEKSIANRPQKSNAYVFYDGPPFITGVPHHGTLLTSVVKDAVPRYWTMKGKRVERRWGWDCHGLPAEVFTEKKLGIQDRRDIGTKVSLAEYITTCRENMVQTGSLWEDTIDRIGRWVDFRGAYKTMDKDYMESVWWAFKQLYEKGKIYEGERVLLYCVRDATPISKAEVAMDNSYQDDTDPSVYAKFKLKDSDMTLLVWTTVPWTLFANTALAVNKDATYVVVDLDGEKIVIAKQLAAKALVDERHQPVPYQVLREFTGQELVGKTYEPFSKDWGKGAHKIHHADFVSIEEGTGIVSQAPAYGEEDYWLSTRAHFPVVTVIDDSGILTESDWKGQQIWDANKDIAKTLLAQGKVGKIEYIRHSYPHCHRCGTKLIYRAHPSWFMDIAGQRSEMLEQNGQVNWFPEHIKNGRSAKTIETAPDWNLSRDRFWASAMPVWKGTDASGKEHIKVIGSYAELKELSGVELEDYHRPWIDDVTFTLDGVEYKRIDKVLDCWFESGSMPFAQFHYPFENVEKFEQNFPGDFIVEYVPQVRAWFYYMNAVNVGLFDKVPFKTALVHGTIAGNDGRKMSKSFGNYTDPNELMDQYSADSLRFLFMTSSLLNGEDYALVDKDVADIARKLSMVWNMYDFFTMYAEVDGWEWNGEMSDPSQDLTNPLDTWIVSRVHQLTAEIEKHMDLYDIPNAVKPILPFIEDASNWYVRRSRRRFWKSDDDADKNDAYRTLHYVLVRLSIAMAPFTPFLAEELYQKLTGGESVHLLDWPATGHIDELSLQKMEVLRTVINQGLSARAQEKLKIRQPLASVHIEGERLDFIDEQDFYTLILHEELNVHAHSVHANSSALIVTLDTEITRELKREGMMREVVRNVQSARKAAGLHVDDRIHLAFSTTDAELRKAIEEFVDVIVGETLAKAVVFDQTFTYETSCSVESAPLTISLEKAELS
jgi:isoleucyl-tRNA synthetase